MELETKSGNDLVEIR